MTGSAASGTSKLSDAERRAWLRLIRSDNIGPITFRALIDHFGDAQAALDALPTLGRGTNGGICSPEAAEREMAAAEANGCHFVALGEAEYPAWLSPVESAPPLLTVRGNIGALARPTVAIVGSRNASAAGRKFAMQIASGLGAEGIVVASGLARGIDAAAHEAALTTGTVAVFAGGLDRPYPSEHANLADAIVDNGGALVSEMPMGWEPRARDFPRRNRLISGLAAATVVIEAALRSGSLITARRAAEQGRLVFAVPGSPLDPRAAGSNLLIKEGAAILTSVDDIFAEIAPMLAEERAPPPVPEAAPAPEAERPTEVPQTDYARIIEALGPSPIEIDDLIRLTGVRPAMVHLVLIELDIERRLARHPGARVSLLD